MTAKSAVDYECTVTDQYGKEVTVHFAVTVNHFKVYPENADVSSSGEKQKTKRIIAETGDAVNLKAVVSADNVKNISYQWVKEDQETGKRKALSNKTSSLKVTVDKYCWYYCTVSDSYDNREQVVFIIEANNFSAYPENPVITGEGNKCSDKTLEAAKGEKLVLRVVTESKSGTGFHYKWYEEKIVNGYPEMVEMSDPDQTDSRYGSSLKVTAANTVSYRCDVSRDDSIYRESVNFTVHVTGTDIPSISSDAPEYDGYEYTYRVTPGEECPMHAIVDNGGQTSGYEIVWLDQDKRVLAEGTDTYTVTVTEDKRYICKVTGSNSRTASANFRVIPDSGLTALPAGITEENYDSDRNRIQITAEPSREIELKVESSVSNNLELHYFWQGRTFDHEGNETSGWQYFDSDSPLLKVSVDEDTRFECLVRDDYGNKKTVIFDVLVSDSKDLNRAIVKLEQSELPYTGKPVKPGVTVYFKGNKLTEGTDYTLKYFNNVNPDLMPSVLVTGAGEYTGKVSLYFRISKLEQNLKITIPSVTTGATGKITVKNAKGHLYYDVVSGRSVVSVDEKGTLKGLKVGTAKIFIGSSEAKGYNEAGRTITVKVLLGAPAKLTATNMVTGVKLTWSRVPGATGYLVRRAGKTIRTISSGTTVSYIDTTANKNGTTYNYTIFARNKAGTGKVYKAVSIYRMSRPAFTSAQNSAAGTMTLKWGKNNAVTGYQIQYSLRSDFSGAKSVTIAKASATARTIKSLTKGKTYYVRIRCYKKTGSAKYYSLWSKTKKITIKK